MKPYRFENAPLLKAFSKRPGSDYELDQRRVNERCNRIETDADTNETAPCKQWPWPRLHGSEQIFARTNICTVPPRGPQAGPQLAHLAVQKFVQSAGPVFTQGGTVQRFVRTRVNGSLLRSRFLGRHATLPPKNGHPKKR